MTGRRFIFIAAWLMLSSAARSSGGVDSLTSALRQPELSEERRADILYELYKCYPDSLADSAMHYVQISLSVSQQSAYKKGIARAWNGIGVLYMRKREAALAMDFYQKALQLRTLINDSDGMAWTYNNMGLAYGDEGNYQMSVLSHSRALDLRQKMGDAVGMEAAYGKRGNAYQMLGDFPSALKDFMALIRVAEKTSDTIQIATGYSAVGNLYDQLGNYDESMKNYRLSSKIYSEVNDRESVLRTYRSLGDIAFKQGLDSVALDEYGLAIELNKRYKPNGYEAYTVYRSISLIKLKQGRYTEAVENCEKAQQMAERMKSTYLEAIACNTMGRILEKQGRLKDALLYENKSLAFAGKTDARDVKINIYQSLADINAALKNYKEAYENEVFYKNEFDSVYNHESDRKIARLQMQYEFKKQQDSLQVAELKKEAAARQQIQKQKAYTVAGAAGLILLSTILFFVYRNYTNQRKATAAMAAARTRAEQSEKFKEQFLANMSHEIRTPMNAVLGMANLALDTPLSEKQQTYVSAIKKSSEDLLVVLNDILDLSKLEAGKMELEAIPFNLREQVSHAMEILRFKAIGKELLFTSAVDENVPQNVIGDPGRLNQILLNLLGNAIKFTPSGAVTLSVQMIGETKDGLNNIRFEVRDTGIGMSPEQKGKIFESFVQGDSDTGRKYGGTGLGLAITKTLVELQGGTIAVKSEAGKGSTFLVAMPYKTGERIIQKQAEKKNRDYSPLSKLWVLVAEDNQLNQIVIKDTLENLVPGIKVEVAPNGRVAVEELQNKKFDMVLMDVHMPEMDGYEATREIRKNLKLKIPVIALTANVIQGDLDKCAASGMDGYVSKPFKRSELLEEMLKHITTNGNGAG